MAKPPFDLSPIDDAARNGRYQCVFGGAEGFAIVRWDGLGWVFSNGFVLHWQPTHYRARAHG